MVLDKFYNIVYNAHMDKIILDFFYEIYDREPYREELQFFRAGFNAGIEFQDEALRKDEDDEDYLDMIEGLLY